MKRSYANWRREKFPKAGKKKVSSIDWTYGKARQSNENIIEGKLEKKSYEGIPHWLRLGKTSAVIRDRQDGERLLQKNERFVP